MKPSDSVSAFEKFVATRNSSRQALTVRSGIVEMLCFYRSETPSNCTKERGDMLLFQWGSYDWGTGKRFEIDITRQFIELGLEDDDAISQLSLTFRFLPDETTVGLGAGNRWCESPQEIDAFRDFITSNQAFQAKADLPPAEVLLAHEYV